MWIRPLAMRMQSGCYNQRSHTLIRLVFTIRIVPLGHEAGLWRRGGPDSLAAWVVSQDDVDPVGGMDVLAEVRHTPSAFSQGGAAAPRASMWL